MGRLARQSSFTGRRGTFTKASCQHAVEFQMGIASVGNISQGSRVLTASSFSRLYNGLLPLLSGTLMGLHSQG